MEDIIDADYRIIEEKHTGINVDSKATVISGIFDIVKESVRCHTEYKMLKEEQKTERDRIKAEYKVLHKKICARHEQLMTIIHNSHQEKMEELNYRHEMQKIIIDNFQVLINKASLDGKYDEMKFLLTTQMEYISQFQNDNVTLIGQNGIMSEKLLGWNPNEVKLLSVEDR